jgi:thiamine biosynthesis lipoprotein
MARMRAVEQVMGTVVSVEAPQGADVRAVWDWLHRVDEVFSTYREGSQISRLGRGELTEAECAPEVREILALCAAAERESGGYFSARVGGRLDPSGAVKGWALERAARMLGPDCLVNGGGDVQAYGRPEPGRGWQVAVAHPLSPGGLATVVSAERTNPAKEPPYDPAQHPAPDWGPGDVPLAVATSGSAERGDHVLDPHTGRPARSLASLTVVGASLTAVDIAATAGFAMGAELARDWIERRPGLEGFAVLPSGRAWWTSGFPRYGLVPA